MTTIGVLSIAGAFVMGVGGGVAAIEKKLDVFGVVTFAIISGLGGGVIRDVLVGRPPEAFRDWRYIACLCLAGAVALVDRGRLLHPSPSLTVLDSLGLAFLAADGCAVALTARMAVPESILLGGISATGSAALRDILLRRVPEVLHSGLTGTTVVAGATVTALVWKLTAHHDVALACGTGTALLMRAISLRYALALPRPSYRADAKQFRGGQSARPTAHTTNDD